MTGEERTVYTEPHGEGMWHDDPDCEFLMGASEVPLTWALKSDLPACSCVEDNH